MSNSPPRISIIVAIGKNRVIGKTDIPLLWHIPEDLKRFKTITNGHPVIMGRKTWESLPAKFRPLSGRTNIVITRQEGYVAEGAVLAHSLAAALEAAKKASGSEEIFVIGGGQIYAEALPFADRLYLTLIDDVKEGDAYFPEYEHLFTRKLTEEAGESNGIRYHWVTLVK